MPPGYEITREADEITEFRAQLYDYLLRNKYNHADIMILACGLIGQSSEQAIRVLGKELFLEMMTETFDNLLKVWKKR